MSPGISTRLLATQSDERLLALVRAGHERAFEALVQRYRRPLLGYCRRLSLPEARAEDVLQQALLKTWLALRDGAEVRDLKAWLYRVVHNTAVNAVRDAARDRDRLAGDPTWQLRPGDVGLERGLVAREALAEVAALPLLQREVIVRTAVGGDSHEQVASDLGITDGAVRGLLYRARATLRAAATALTPPPLLNWLAGGASAGGPAPERLAALTAGGGSAGLAGLMLKGGVAALTAGTLITGAAVVQLAGRAQRGAPRAPLSAATPARGVGLGAGSSALSASAGGSRGWGSPNGRRAGQTTRTRPGGPVARIDWRAGMRRSVAQGDGQRSRATPGASGGAEQGAPPTERTVAVTIASGPAPGAGQAGGSSAAAGSGQSAGSGQAGDSGQDGSAGQGASSGAGQGDGSGGGQAGGAGGGQGSAGAGEAGAGAGSGSPSQGAGAGGGAPSGGEAGAGSAGSGGQSGAGEQTSSGSQGGSSGAGSSGSAAGGAGGLAGTVVREVGSIVEHLLH